MLKLVNQFGIPDWFTNYFYDIVIYLRSKYELIKISNKNETNY